MLIMSSRRQIDGLRVSNLQNHGHVTTENDFPIRSFFMDRLSSSNNRVLGVGGGMHTIQFEEDRPRSDVRLL